MKKVLIGVFLTLVLVAAAFAGAQVIGRVAVPEVQASTAVATPTEQASTDALTQSDVLTSLEDALTSVYDKVSPSVVYIEVTQIAQVTTMRSPWGSQQQPDQQQETTGSGTGFVWDKEGHIVTNNHVVEDADEITVTFSDGTTVPAKVVGTDENSDLAVLSVDVDAAKLTPVTLGDSTQVKVGQLTVAIGNPFGLENTLTVGFVSAIGRSLPVDTDTDSSSSTYSSTSSYTIPDVIQTDASINPGNSGGVLLNSKGEVIGVTFAIYSSTGSSAGIGFAIPASTVNKVVPALIKNGEYKSSWIGISGTSLTSELAEAMDLSSDQRGVLIAEVVTGGPADDAGLQGSTEKAEIDGDSVEIGGDVLVAIDGQPIDSFDALTIYLARSTTPGQEITLTILRNGKEQSVKVTLGERPSTTSEALSTDKAAS